MQVLLKSRWHNVQEPEKDPQIWQRGFIETGKTDPMADHPLWDELRNVWQRVSDSLGFGQERRAREQRRQNNRRAAEQALNDLWPKLSQEAKRRLAQHHATMIVCADQEEVGEWERHLKAVFPSAEKHSETAGFVYWITNREGKRVVIVVWNGMPTTTPDAYLHAHEIAHIVDGDPAKERLSADPEWLNVWQREKDEIASKFIAGTRRRRIDEDKTEAFAALLAITWIEPRYLKTRQGLILDYFRRRGLLPSSPSIPRTPGDPAR